MSIAPELMYNQIKSPCHAANGKGYDLVFSW